MYKKIAIVGAPGTGKTTLANNLSEIYKIPATHIDGIHHLENWEIRDKEERDKIILEIASRDEWIIDGTYKSTLRDRFERADLIIWLDFSTLAQLKGVLGRYLKNKGKEKSRSAEVVQRDKYTNATEILGSAHSTSVYRISGIDI